MDTNNKNLYQLSQKEGNEICADCKRADWEDLRKEKKKSGLFGKKKDQEINIPEVVTEWVNKKYGVFICADCAESHKKLDADGDDVITVLSVNENDNIIKKCEELGNVKSNEIYEYRIPFFIIKASNKTIKNLTPLRDDYIKDKYKKGSFKETAHENYKIRMPEYCIECDAFRLKGKKSWERLFLIHQHNWIFIYSNAIEPEPNGCIYVNSITDCSIEYFPSKESQPLYCFSITHKNEKKAKEKTLTFNVVSIDKLKDFVTSIRKAMCFYAVESNLPKSYHISEIEEISKLMIRNSPCKGYLYSRSSNNFWNKRYFALVGPSLYIFRKEGETKPMGMMEIYNAEIKMRMQIYKEKRFSFVMICEKRTFFLSDENKEGIDIWIDNLREKCKDHPIRRKFDFFEVTELPHQDSE